LRISDSAGRSSGAIQRLSTPEIGPQSGGENSESVICRHFFVLPAGIKT